MQTTWLHYIVDIIKQACENIWYYLHVVIIINNYYRKVSTKNCPVDQFSDVACNTRNGSFPCFSHCFNNYSIVTTCNQTEIFCGKPSALLYYSEY